MWRRDITIRQAIILSAYILFQAKEHVEGCGGDSHIAVLRDHGPSGLVDWRNVWYTTTMAERSDSLLAQLILDYADLSQSKEEFLTRAKASMDILAQRRETDRVLLEKEKEDWESIYPLYRVDDLGLPSPPGNENPEDSG